MTNIDQFESVFKAADKPPFRLEGVQIKRVTVVTSLEDDASQSFQMQSRGLLQALPEAAAIQWTLFDGSQFHDVPQLLDLIAASTPDLICTYRNLHSAAPDHPYSLGSYVDVMAQTIDVPVLLLPTPDKLATCGQAFGPCRAVIAITDHLTGDHHLVSYAAHLTDREGMLYLSHVEDEKIFTRYMHIIGKIPAINTEEARETLLHQMLKEPRDYIDSAREVLRVSFPQLQVEEVVTLGHHLTEYKSLVELRQVDLIVMYTKDEDQLAMHGLAYPLAVELRDTPLLLL